MVVFSDEETAASVDLDAQLAQADAIVEQISFEEAQKSKKALAGRCVNVGGGASDGAA